MGIKSHHPKYTELLPFWQIANDSYQGETAIKGRGEIYLPMTSGQIADGAKNTTSTPTAGALAYAAYVERSVYPDLYADAVDAAVGIMHREPPTIDLPESMKYMLDDCTLLGDSLESLLRKINANQLIDGRLGLLGDIAIKDGKPAAVIVTYNSHSVINWADTHADYESGVVKFVVLDESGDEMTDDFAWTTVERYRVLALAGPDGEVADEGNYASAVLTSSDDLAGVQLEEPNMGGNRLTKIPFVFVNAKDLSPNPDQPPLDGLARICLAIYRGEADYRQSLFMQGQDTLVRIGSMDEDEQVRTGAGARIDCQIGGDAKYIGVSSTGLPEQRQSLENLYARAAQKSGQMLNGSDSKESGEALRIRVSAQTATLPQLAKTGAAALQQVLRYLAEWQGANPDEVVVKPNLNFSEADLNGQTLMNIMQAKALGAPIAEASIHEWVRDNGLTKLSYEEELNLIASEDPMPGASIPSSADE